MKKLFSTTIALILLFSFVFSFSLFGERTQLSPEVYKKRREALMKKVGKGFIILFAGVNVHHAYDFRQDNDFYYFTGIEEPNAMLLMSAQRGKSGLYLPTLHPREEEMRGTNLLKDPDALKKTGFDSIHAMNDFIRLQAWFRSQPGIEIYLRLTAPDTEAASRRETALYHGMDRRNPFNDLMPLDNYRVKKFKEFFPNCVIKDITAFIDELRLIKTPEEIEILRENGKISAQAHIAAYRATRPGVYEYEIEAAAMSVIWKNGAQRPAYPPIVASGPNNNILHYDKNHRKAQKGELILMDFAAELDYQCMDISRTWPVSGKFSPEQRDAYKVVLEVQKAIIEALHPGATPKDIYKYVDEKMKRLKIDTRGLKGHVDHYVGMSTHDVGPRGVPLKEGMVFAIEPGLYYPEKNFGIRIEDTVLITKDGCEILTKDVPKEIEEIEALVGKK